MLKKAAGIQSGAKNPLKDRVGKISRERLRQIAEEKMPDLNANDVEMAMHTIAGTARSMGIEITD
jgi:large subunit ribosomal protein L11